MNKQTGFTLIELMIVVAIIAILAAIAISQYQDYVAKAQLSESMSIADGMKTKIAEIYTQTASCPANTVWGIPAEGSISGKYVLKTVTGGTATADGGCTMVMTFRGTGSVSKPISGRDVTFTLQGIDSGAARWVCSTLIEKKYLPRTCQ